jgi:hypothetical protein
MVVHTYNRSYLEVEIEGLRFEVRPGEVFETPLHSTRKLGMVVHACVPAAWEMEEDAVLRLTQAKHETLPEKDWGGRT